MTHHNARRLHNTWAILVAIVLLGMVMMMFWGSTTAVTVALLSLAVIKCRFVVLDFMGLRQGPVGLRFGLLAWPVILVLVAVAKLVMGAVPFA